MRDRQAKLLVAGVTIAALAPFLNKAYDIDDPLFLWMAQQIAQHPFDPYGSTVQWAATAQPMWVAMQNPPLCSYYIAFVGSIFGFGELAMHLAFLVPAVFVALGTYTLAKRFCRIPVLATLLTIFTPVFLISASHVMCDVMHLAFWLWAIHYWLLGLEEKKWHFLVLGSLLLTGATLTKYFGLSLLPLLFVYTVARNRRFYPGLAYLTLPVLAIVAFEFLTQQLYGHPLFTGSMSYLRTVAAEVRIPLPTRFLTGCSFVGGCMIVAVALAWLGGAKSTLRGLLLLFFVGLVVWLSLPLPEVGRNVLALRLQTSLFACVGLAILGLALWDIIKERSADSLLLLLWTFGTFLFATFLNWSVTARTLLPMAPAVSILLVRHWDRTSTRGLSTIVQVVWIAGAMTIAFVVAVADYYEADASRVGARYIQKRYGAKSAQVWFQSHWGFQYYMQRWQAKPLVREASIRPGDFLIIPSNNADPLPPPRPAIWRGGVSRSIIPLAATFAPGTGAGFYSSVRGPVPWAFARTLPDRFDVYKFR